MVVALRVYVRLRCVTVPVTFPVCVTAARLRFVACGHGSHARVHGSRVPDTILLYYVCYGYVDLDSTLFPLQLRLRLRLDLVAFRYAHYVCIPCVVAVRLDTLRLRVDYVYGWLPVTTRLRCLRLVVYAFLYRFTLLVTHVYVGYTVTPRLLHVAVHTRYYTRTRFGLRYRYGCVCSRSLGYLRSHVAVTVHVYRLLIWLRYFVGLPVTFGYGHCIYIYLFIYI